MNSKSSNCFIFNCKSPLYLTIHKTLYKGDMYWVQSTFPNLFRHHFKWLACTWNQINCFRPGGHPRVPGSPRLSRPRQRNQIHSRLCWCAVQMLRVAEQVSNLFGHKPFCSFASHVNMSIEHTLATSMGASQPLSFYAMLSDRPPTELGCLTHHRAGVASTMHVLFV